MSRQLLVAAIPPLLAFLLSVGCGGGAPSPAPPSGAPHGGTGSPDLRDYWSHGTCQGDGVVPLSATPLGFPDLAKVIPAGLMVGGHVTPSDHTYWLPPDMGSADAVSRGVHAAADGAIVQIQHRTSVKDPSRAGHTIDEYRMVIEHSCSYWTYLDGLGALDPAVLSALGGDVPGGQTLPTRIPVVAGQVVGTIQGKGIDFAVVDGNVTLPGFIEPDHYAAEPWKVHTTDPFAGFPAMVQEKILALDPRQAAPRGGKIDYDRAGTAAGNWFKPGADGFAGDGDSRGPWASHLALVYHHIDPTRLVISLGDWEGTARQFAVEGNAPDPSTVTAASGPVKYDLVYLNLNQDGVELQINPSDPVIQERMGNEGVLLVQVLDDRRMRVEMFPEKELGDVQGFDDGALIYTR